MSRIELGEFLRSGNGPEQQALLRLIATLVEVPPYALERQGRTTEAASLPEGAKRTSGRPRGSAGSDGN